MTYLLDTNVFLVHLLDEEGADDSERLLELFERQEISGYYTVFSLHSLEVILHRLNKLSQLEQFLLYLQSLPTLEFLTPTFDDEIEIVHIVKQYGLDIDDATQYYFAKKQRAALVSFDKDFDKTDLVRIEPSKIVRLHSSSS